MRITIKACWFVIVERGVDGFNGEDLVDFFVRTHDEDVYRMRVVPKNANELCQMIKDKGSINPAHWIFEGEDRTPLNHQHSGLAGSPD